MKSIALFLLATLLPLMASDGLVVYSEVPGLPASSHYQVRIRSVGNEKWTKAFAYETVCNFTNRETDNYFDSLAGWTHAYVNFEMSGPVEVEIVRANGNPVRSAAVHPQRKSSACEVKDGRVIVRLDKPCLVAVDIDGKMDSQDTGKGYKGPALHTISLFANPPLEGKPNPGDAGVFLVKPGEKPPIDGDWKTLYFLPGVHDVGLTYPLRNDCHYYIPGDAMVYGTLSNRKWGGAKMSGFLAMARYLALAYSILNLLGRKISADDHGKYRPIEIVGTTDTRVEGITIADSATHSLMLVSPYTEGKPNEIRWTKIFTWRANGDGINPFGNTLVEDCFLRTQDDSLYVNGRGIRRCVIWNDANGSAFVLSSLQQLENKSIVVEDCDVIYARAKWHHWSGGRVFNMRGEGEGDAGSGVIFRNINVSDPRPTLQQFFVCMSVPEPYSKEKNGRDRGDLSGILFENISIAAPSVIGEPQMFWGTPEARVRNIKFRNVRIAGKPLLDGSQWKTNEHVSGLIFEKGTSNNQ